MVYIDRDLELQMEDDDPAGFFRKPPLPKTSASRGDQPEPVDLVAPRIASEQATIDPPAQVTPLS
jgi:hypothetical protein